MEVEGREDGSRIQQRQSDYNMKKKTKRKEKREREKEATLQLRQSDCDKMKEKRRDEDKEEERKETPTLHSDKKQKKKRRREEEKRKEEGKEKRKVMPTVTIAVPGSIMDNAQSLELATLLAGQIARAATIFRIHEVVVFDNKATSADDSVVTTAEDGDENESGAQFLTRILQYLETPQYLRRRLFPMHNNLRFVGLLPPLDAPHHVRKHEWSPFREGVTLEGNLSKFKGTTIDVGLSKNVLVEQVLEPGLRVTIAMGTNRNIETDCFKKVVTPSTPREEMGLYWGYKVRYSQNVSSVFKNCPYKNFTSPRKDMIILLELQNMVW